MGHETDMQHKLIVVQLTLHSLSFFFFKPRLPIMSLHDAPILNPNR